MTNAKIASSLLLLALAGAAGAQPVPPTMTFTAAQLLANDNPGPPNEGTQTLTITGVRTTAASRGTATFANGVISYVPEAGFFGSAQLFYTACDNGATNGTPDPLCSEGTITINVVANRVPTATSQQLTTAEDASIGVPLAAADADGDALSFRVVTSPSNGTLSGTAPALTYTPAPNFNGVDSFTFAVNDGFDESVPATVSFNVTEVNDVPVGQIDSTVAAAGRRLTLLRAFLLGNDTAGPFNENGQTLMLTTITAGPNTNGVVSLGADDLVFDPNPGFVGTAVIEYAICDNGTTNGAPDQLCAASTLTVVLNGPPVAQSQAAETIRTAPLPLVLSATDPENDALAFAIVAPPQRGTLSGTPPALTYVANAGFVGNDSFTFTAADAYSTSNTATVSIVINDPPPVLLSGDSLTVPAGGDALIDVLANDTPGTGSFDLATLAVTGVPSKGVAVLETSRIRYTANAGASGDDGFSYTVCDGAGACGGAFVTVTITVNQPPTANGDSYTTDAGATLNVAPPGLLANDTDPDAGDQLQARLGTGVSAGSLLLRSDGSFSYTPAASFGGTDGFTYFVVDRSGLSSPPVAVTIEVIPAGPLAVDDTYQTTSDNALTVMPPGVLANDRDSRSTGPLTARLDRAPFRGILDLNTDGSFVYTPDPGFVGTDTFRYVAVNLQGVPSAFAIVTIEVTEFAGPVPTLSCPAPADGSRVTAPVAVTASVAPPAGETITQWTVTARNLDRGTPVVLASGNGQPPATLATFDPTMLVNGSYEILTRAVSSGGGTRTCATDVFVTGEMKLGDYQTTYLDMEASVVGFPVQLLRTYDTTDKRVGDFGVGWRLELSGPRATPNGRLGQSGWFTEAFGFPFTQQRFLTTIPHFVTVTSPGGRVEVFDLTPPPTGPLLALTVPAYTARAGTGTTSTLEDVDSPTLSLTGTGGSLVDFFGGVVYDPRLFRLTTKEGVEMIIDRYDGLQSVTDRNGNSLLFTPDGVFSSSATRNLAFLRDGAGRITQIDGPSGKQTRYEYSSAGDLIRFVAANGAADTFTYDGSNRLLIVDGPGGTRLRTLSYGPDGRIASITDGTGRTTAISSNVNARSTIVTSPSGRLTTLTTYGADGYPASVEEAFDGRSRVTSYEYDAEGRVVRTTKPLGRVETLTYDAAGNVTSRTTPRNETWSFAFNSLNLPTTTTAPDGAVVESYSYDAFGNVTAAAKRNGTVVAYVNDSRGLPLTATDSFGTTTFQFDDNQQLVRLMDPAGGVTTMSYDASGRLISTRNPAGEITRFQRDTLDQLVRVTAANDSAYALSYDALGRLASVTDTAGRTSRYEYDAANRLVRFVDRVDRSRTYDYDADGNMGTVTYADGEVQTGTWDPVGRLVSLADADTVVERGYNDANDLVSERTRGNNGVALPDVTLSYTTDPNGRRLTSSGPGGVITYAYDARGRLSLLLDDMGDAFTPAYGTTDRLTGLSRPNGVDDLLSYQENMLTARNASIAGVVRARADYVLDSLGRRASLTDLDGSHAFTHDLANQLVAATHPAASGLSAESFAYDLVGNRTSWTGSPPGSVSHDTGMQLTRDGTYDYTYDAEGRLTQRRDRGTGGITRYTWSDAGTLTSITAPNGATSTYRYDAIGRRLESNDSGTIRRFVYSGSNLSNEFDAANTLRATYIAGQSPDSVYEIVRDGTRYYPLFDGVGSVTTLTDAAGAIVGRVRYSAFGIPQSSGVTENSVSFTGHQFDAATGLIYARARYYDPTLGRFLSQDPDPAINPYSYALNAPLEATDPTGRGAVYERANTEAKTKGAQFYRFFNKRVREIQRDAGVDIDEATRLFIREAGPWSDAVEQLIWLG